MSRALIHSCTTGASPWSPRHKRRPRSPAVELPEVGSLGWLWIAISPAGIESCQVRWAPSTQSRLRGLVVCGLWRREHNPRLRFLLAARFYKVIKSSGQKSIFLKSQSESRGEGADRRTSACSSKSKCPGMDTLAASESGASQKEQRLRDMASLLSGVRTSCQTTAFWVETGRKGCSENTGALVRSRCELTGRDPLVTIVYHKHKALVLGHGP